MVKYSTLFLAALMVLTTSSMAQSGGSSRVKDRSEDAFRELNTGELTLRFTNALSGDYVEGAHIIIDDKNYITDFEGKVLFTTDRVNGRLPVSFRKEGFISSDFDVEIMVGSVWQNQISVSPVLHPKEIRIVLDWSHRPKDLDAHFIKKGGYHISYRNKKTSEDGLANLDRDNRNGNGPETITIREISISDSYTYKVMDYSNRKRSRSKHLSNRSRAVVRVYGDNRLMHTYRIGGNEAGNEWTVFEIKNGQFIPIDTIN